MTIGTSTKVVVVELLSITDTQLFLQPACILEGQIGDVAETRVGSGAEQPIIDLSRISH